MSNKVQKNRICEDCNIRQVIYGDPIDRYARWCTQCARKSHPNTVNVKSRMCDRCKVTIASFALSDGSTRICKKCKLPSDNALNVRAKKCEDCELVICTFGLEQGKPKWCKICSKNHEGSFDIKHKMCEICKVTRPVMGTVDEGKMRWCYDCSKNLSIETTNLMAVICKDCKVISANYGYEKREWCTTCAKNHNGAIYLGIMCEDCFIVRPSYGDQNTRRWCKTCSLKHENVRRITGVCEKCNVVCASFGYEEDKVAKWCRQCSIDDKLAINVVTKRCQNPQCPTQYTINYLETFCAACDPSPRRLRSKELRIVNLLEENISKTNMFCNRVVGGGNNCNGRLTRPDILFDCGHFILIVEVDEHQHKQYKDNDRCELKRMVEIMNCYGLPAIFIRYNPDTYRIDGRIQKIPQEMRDKYLLSTVQRLLQQELGEITSQVIYLYYDNMEVGKTYNLQKLVDNHIAQENAALVV